MVSTERAFAAELSRITTEIRATSTFTLRNSGAPRPMPSLTPPWESVMAALMSTLPTAARFVRRPSTRAIPSASSPARMSCAKSSTLGTTTPRMKSWKKGGACETKPPASRLVANCCGNPGFSSFSMAPLSQTAPTSTRTHTIPFTARLLSEGPGSRLFYVYARPWRGDGQRERRRLRMYAVRDQRRERRGREDLAQEVHASRDRPGRGRSERFCARRLRGRRVRQWRVRERIRRWWRARRECRWRRTCQQAFRQEDRRRDREASFG